MAKIVSDLEHEAPIQIHQEVNIWVSEVEANRDLDFDILKIDKLI